jgi:hypothetical protein
MLEVMFHVLPMFMLNVPDFFSVVIPCCVSFQWLFSQHILDQFHFQLWILTT